VKNQSRPALRLAAFFRPDETILSRNEQSAQAETFLSAAQDAAFGRRTLVCRLFQSRNRSWVTAKFR